MIIRMFLDNLNAFSSLHTPRPLCKSCRHTAPCPPPAPRSRWRLCVPSGRPPGGPRGKRLFSAFAPHPCLRALPLPRPLPQVHAPTHQVHHLPTIALIPPAPAWWRLRVREVPAPGRGCEGSTLCRRRAAPPPPPLMRGPANVPLNHSLVHCTSVCVQIAQLLAHRSISSVPITECSGRSNQQRERVR